MTGFEDEFGYKRFLYSFAYKYHFPMLVNQSMKEIKPVIIHDKIYQLGFVGVGFIIIILKKKSIIRM